MFRYDSQRTEVNTRMSDQQAADEIPQECATLYATIEAMDGLAQAAFSEIASVMKLALAYLEGPDAYRRLDDVANAMKLAWARAEDAQSCITSEAGRVGCEHVDQASLRRSVAQQIAERTARVLRERVAEKSHSRSGGGGIIKTLRRSIKHVATAPACPVFSWC